MEGFNNHRRNVVFSLFELECRPYQFNFRKTHHHIMTNLIRCNKSDQVWNGANSVFQLTFSRRRRLWCWSLLSINCERTPSSHSRVLSSAISTLVLTRVTSHDYPKRRVCSQAQAFWWKAQSGCNCKLYLVFASSRIMTINVLVYKLAFKKSRKNTAVHSQIGKQTRES